MSNPSTVADFVPAIPRLEAGDRLGRAEFEQRYFAMPDSPKIELIEGEVHMPSPVRTDLHGTPHSHISGLLAVYAWNTPGVRSAVEASLRLDFENEPRPDAFLMIEAALGGQAKMDDDGFVSGAPELVVEISASTVSIDLHKKLRIYQRNGVREYVVWRVVDRMMDWFVQDNGVLVKRAFDAILKSQAFPGLWLNAADLVSNRTQSLLATLMEGLATAEHAAFVGELRSKKR